MEKVIEVKNLTKEYKEQKAVDNLSFDVKNKRQLIIYHLMYMKEKY